MSEAELSELKAGVCSQEIYLTVGVKAAGNFSWLLWLVFDALEECLCLLGLTVHLEFPFFFRKPIKVALGVKVLYQNIQ